MKILIFSAFDPIPSDNISPIRYALLAEEFLNNGHEVEYVTSRYFHLQKKFREEKDWSEKGTPQNLKLTIIPAPAYKKHIGLRRLYSHYVLAQNLRKYLKELTKEKYPKLIISAYPPIWTNYFLSTWAKQHDITFITDIQDLWPYNFKQLLPFNKFTSNALQPLKSLFHKTLHIADGVAAVSEDYLFYLQKIIGKKPKNVFHLGTPTFFPITDTETDRYKSHILYIGSSQINYPLLNAIQLIDKSDKYQIDVVGFSGNKEKFDEFCETNSLKNVNYISWPDFTKDRYKNHQYKLGLTIINTDSLVAFPNKVFAYFAYGLPIINNIAGGELQELITKNKLGITLNNINQESIENAIQYCTVNFSMADRERIQQFAKTNFNSSNIYNSYYQWCLEVLSSSKKINFNS